MKMMLYTFQIILIIFIILFITRSHEIKEVEGRNQSHVSIPRSSGASTSFRLSHDLFPYWNRSKHIKKHHIRPKIRNISSNLVESQYMEKYKDYLSNNKNNRSMQNRLSKASDSRPYQTCTLPIHRNKIDTYSQEYLDDIISTNPKPKTKVLVCDYKHVENHPYPSHYIYGDMQKHSFPTKCPIVYDYLGKSHHGSFTCVASNQPNYCIFNLTDVIVSVCGGLVDVKTRQPYSFYHNSMGYLEPVLDPKLHRQFQSYFIREAIEMPYVPEIIKEYDIVIPARMPWDIIFNHITHQSFPIIAHIYELLPSNVWKTAYWHCNIFTGAILALLDVPIDHVLIQSHHQKLERQEPIFARHIIMPFIPGWLPSQIPSFFSITNRVMKLFTKNLYKKFEYNKLMFLSPKKSTIIYLRQSRNPFHYVENEDEILRLLNDNINHVKYELIIVNDTIETKRIDKLHQQWYKKAIYFSKAAVIIGSHGSAFSHMITAPDDVDYIEFNLFPDDIQYYQSPIDTVVRISLTSSAFMKGGTGKYYIIDPYNKSITTFYNHEISVSPYELFETLKLIGKDILISNKSIIEYQPRKHVYF